MSVRLQIRLWGRASGFHARKAIWALQELALPFELIDAGFGTPPTPAFLARNPSALAPVIDDGGVVVWESNVIVRYLCETYSPGVLAPAGPARFQAEQWMDWNATTLWPAIRPLHHAAAARAAPLSETERARRLTGLDRWLEVLEGRLGASRFLAGEAFTMADVPAAVSLDRWRRLARPGCPRPHLTRWLDDLTARPAFPPEP